MFIRHEFAVDGILVKGENLLEVKFRSAVNEVAQKPLKPAAFTAERLNTRRIQCTYGWDWVDRFVTVGIFRDVRLVSRKRNRIENVYIYTSDINPYSAQLTLRVDFGEVVAGSESLTEVITAPDGSVVFSKKRTILRDRIDEVIDIPSPKLWYPNGYGEQPLYSLSLCTDNCRKAVTFGIRRITLLQLEDAPGSPEEALCRQMQQLDYLKELDRNEKTSGFTLLCNGVRIMCKGANWVPCEPFPSAETPEKISALIDLAAKGGANMIRVWGGGIFEQDSFYDACDRKGILVTQDFLMACGDYPEDEDWFIEALKKETREAALRLRNHPCLAWWSGDNENAVRGNENSDSHTGYKAATYGIEPIISELDPARRFLPSSPYGGDMFCSATKGTGHNTYFLGNIFRYMRESDFSDYREFFSSFITRFSAEQAAFGLPFVSTLRRFMTEEDIFGEDRSVSEFHMKNNPALGETTLFEYVNIMAQKIFGKYTDPADRIRKQQMLHCEWIRLTFEAHRRRKWFSSGLVYWMFNDCWPAANGWSLVDYYTSPKPGYYAFKRCAKPVIASLSLKDGSLSVHICNDGVSAVYGSCRVYLYDVDSGDEQTVGEFFCRASANSTKEFPLENSADILSELTPSRILLCDHTSPYGNDRAMFIPKRFSDLPITYTEPKVTDNGDGTLTVTADSFLPYAIVDHPGLEDNCMTLKKGESVTVRISEK